MRKIGFGLLGLSLTVGFLAGGGGIAQADPDVGKPTRGPQTSRVVRDDLPGPQEDKRRDLRQKAIRMVLNGQAKVQTINGSKVVKVGRRAAPLTAQQRAKVRAGEVVRAKQVDQYVELAREKTDKIFVVLTEFGNQRDPNYPDQDTDPDTAGPAVFDGPLHNAIPEPDRTRNNKTIWQPDFSADHYRQLYFGTGQGVQSLKTYYETQSSGRYSVDGLVTDWVKVPYNEARYGRSNGYPCDDIVCNNTYDLLRDGLAVWVASQQAKGQTDAEIKAALSSYDQQDRNDYDGDGNFSEPDGYIDHFQIVHSGGDQADGDPYQGEDAIWSHRGNAYDNLEGTTGPAYNKLGGTQIGTTGLWVSDYTIQPENGGLSVFAHEYGHDLGLPDHYDTQASGDNPVNWWTLMAQSRARAKNDVGIGTRPADLGSWDKLQLGWLDYEVAIAGQQKTYQLGPHEYNSKKAQGLVVVLPKKVVTTTLVPPATGAKQWWSGTGNNLDNTLTRTVSIPAGPSTLTFKANYDIEEGYDRAQVQVKPAGSNDWTSVAGSLTTVPGNNSIDGTTNSAYVTGTYDMSAYAGQTIQLRFRYRTDGGAAGNDDIPGNNGFFVDDIALTAGGTTVFSDGAEIGANGWTAVGFSAVGATLTKAYDHYYIATYRTYESYDRYLKTGPYNFGFGPTLPDKAEFFPYQRGLLVNYWDTSYADNNTSQHSGAGLVLPIDAHPAPIYGLDGNPWRGRIQTYDAPFSLRRAASFTLHINGKPSYIRGAAAEPLFDDTRSYENSALPRVGVKTPGIGVTLEVTQQTNTTMRVRLGTSKPVSPAAVRATLARG